MTGELLRAFFLIFAAEMGDKTQIIAMTFATQYKVKDVIMGVTLGVLANHGIAILLGNFISKVIPMNLIQIIAGFLFIYFGINALLSDDEDEMKNRNVFSPITTVALAFFVGELGDKTQLTAMTLAAEAMYPLVILLGTTLGMIVTSGMGIFIGSKIGNKIPEVLIKVVSSTVFVFFGTLKLLNTLPERFLTPINIMLFLMTIITIEFVLIMKLFRVRQLQKDTPMRAAARNLYNQTQALKETLDSICLGEDKCGTCTGVGCLMGYTRFILKESRDKGDYYNNLYVNMDKLIRKDYDREKVTQALFLIIKDYNQFGWDIKEDYVINKVKASLEIILFGDRIKRVGCINDYIKEVTSYNKSFAKLLKKKFC